MRATWLVLVLAACAPRVSTAPRTFDDDLGPREAAPASAPEDQRRPVAPPGKGLRAGTIARAQLVAVLDAGPGNLLRQLEVAPHMSGDRFVGWQLVQLLDGSAWLHDVDVAPGDVLLAINGQLLARPEQLQTVWDSLRTANEIHAQMWRGDQKLELRFKIEPSISGHAAR